MIYAVDEIARIVRPIAQRYRLRAVYLFGSYARGAATEDSDIDLLIDTTGTNIKSLLQVAAVYCELEEALGKPVDLVTVSSLEQEARMPSEESFRKAVWKEKVDIYVAATADRIQWGPIKGMRNLVAHSYGSMSRDIIWETAVTDIPVLQEFCEQQLMAEDQK